MPENEGCMGREVVGKGGMGDEFPALMGYPGAQHGAVVAGQNNVDFSHDLASKNAKKPPERAICHSTISRWESLAPGAEKEEDLKGDDRKEAEKNNEAARLWISGLEAVNRKLGVARVMDLSATPFFLRGSGYAEGTLFPWTMPQRSAATGNADRQAKQVPGQPGLPKGLRSPRSQQPRGI